MGDPVGEPYVEGLPCVHCWGPGKPFGDELPPKYASITLSGLLPPFDVANVKWIAVQDPDLPCWWDFEDENIKGYMGFTDFLTELYLAIKPDFIPWITFVSGLCDPDFTG